MDILTTIRNQYNTFNKTQKRIADYILQHPDISSFSTLRELAISSKTTEATIISFSRKLGCKSFIDLKIQLQNFISQWMSPNEKIKTAIHQNTGANNTYEQLIQSEQEALNQTFKYISSKDFEKSLDLLKEARRVYVLSYDYANTISSLFTARFIRLGVDVIDLGSKTIPDVLYNLALSNEKDLFVLFSYAPYSPLPIKLAKYMQSIGANVICFSDSASSPVAQCSNIIFTSITNHTIFFNSMTAPVSLVNLMASEFVNKNKERFDAYKEKVDALQEAAGKISY